MAPATNRDLARKLRIIAKAVDKEQIRSVLLESADRLEKPGHKQKKKRAVVLYSVWDNRTDQLVAVDLPAKDCIEMMGIGYSGFMAAIRRGSMRWRIEKRFADEDLVVDS